MKTLAGRKIVITRSTEQAGATAELVSSFEAIPVVVPLVEVVDDESGMSELRSLDMASLEWVVVTSPNGARRVAPLLGSDGVSPRLAAVGSATAASLPRCDLVAETQSALGLLDVFPSGAGRVVVVQAVDAEPTLTAGLRERNWDVVAITPYRTISASPTDAQRLAAIAADAVLFASGSAARAWFDVFGTQTPPIVIAIGDQTAAAAERAGLKITAVSADHSMYGMLVTLSRYFPERN